jgi:hypothetical protein
MLGVLMNDKSKRGIHFEGLRKTTNDLVQDG